MTTNTFDPRARAKKIAADLKAAEAAQAAYDASITEALNNAGRTRVEFVEELYKHFGIEAETTPRKDKDGKPVVDKNGAPVLVKTDKDESKRIAKLAEAFGTLVAAAEPKPEAATPASNSSETVKSVAATASPFEKRSA